MLVAGVSVEQQQVLDEGLPDLPLPGNQAKPLPSTCFPASAAIVGLRRGIQCGMGRSWGGHGLSRNTDCPPLSAHPPAIAIGPIQFPV